MNATDWTAIPGRLKDAGFTLCYERISYDPARPLWSAKASRDGRHWCCLGGDLGAAFVELERQMTEDAVDWREVILRERPLADCTVGIT
ncbi:MAG: hypothetical protein ABIP20_14505 [Chthoniobacteraceae bacterium]